MNLLMCAPLNDDKGTVRYFIGAQVDVSGLVVDGRGIESFRAFLQSDTQLRHAITHKPSKPQIQVSCLFPGDEATDHPLRRKTSGVENETSSSFEPLDRLRALTLLFNQDETDVVSRNSTGTKGLNRLYLRDETTPAPTVDGHSVYEGREGGRGSPRQGRTIIDPDTIHGGPDMSTLTLKPRPSSGLPGVYKHVS
jgi:hypothetical protein